MVMIRQQAENFGLLFFYLDANNSPFKNFPVKLSLDLATLTLFIGQYAQN